MVGRCPRARPKAASWPWALGADIYRSYTRLPRSAIRGFQTARSALGAPLRRHSVVIALPGRRAVAVANPRWRPWRTTGKRRSSNSRAARKRSETLGNAPETLRKRSRGGAIPTRLHRDGGRAGSPRLWHRTGPGDLGSNRGRSRGAAHTSAIPSSSAGFAAVRTVPPYVTSRTTSSGSLALPESGRSALRGPASLGPSGSPFRVKRAHPARQPLPRQRGMPPASPPPPPRPPASDARSGRA